MYFRRLKLPSLSRVRKTNPPKPPHEDGRGLSSDEIYDRYHNRKICNGNVVEGRVSDEAVLWASAQNWHICSYLLRQT